MKKIVFIIIVYTKFVLAFDLSSISTNIISAGSDILNNEERKQDISIDNHCKNMFESYDFNYAGVLKVASTYAIGNSNKLTSFFTNDNISLEEKSKLFKNFSKKIAKGTFWIPIEIEKIYGELSLKSRIESGDVILKSTKNKKYKEMYLKVDNFIKEYKTSLKDNNIPFNIKVYILSSEKKAEATPYGHIFISQDFIKNNQYKTVLSHELSHISKRHVTKELQYRIVSTYDNVTDVMSLIKNMQDVKGYQKAFSVRVAMELVSKQFELYSQEQELEADACGLRTLIIIDKKNKHKHIKSIIKNIEYTASKQKEKDLFKINEHPSKEKRIKNINELGSLL